MKKGGVIQEAKLRPDKRQAADIRQCFNAYQFHCWVSRAWKNLLFSGIQFPRGRPAGSDNVPLTLTNGQLVPFSLARFIQLPNLPTSTVQSVMKEGPNFHSFRFAGISSKFSIIHVWKMAFIVWVADKSFD